MKSSQRLQYKLWQLANRWLPPFLVPLEPYTSKPEPDYNHWPRLDINFAGLIKKLWPLSFSWLNLFFLPPLQRDSRGRIISRPQPRQLVLPFTQQFATSVAMIAAGLFGVAYFTFFAGSAPSANQSAFIAPPAPSEIQSTSQGLSRSAPIAIRIPKIAVNAPTSVELGLKADGTMETPEKYEVVGWYKKAPTPGQTGPAILVGHVDNYLGPAVFFRLSELVPGDIIEVDRADGKTVKFAVEGLERYPQDNFPTAKVYGNLDYSGLRLITCGGQFNALTQRYSDNTVVYAKMLEGPDS